MTWSTKGEVRGWEEKAREDRGRDMGIERLVCDGMNRLIDRQRQMKRQKQRG